MHPSLAPLPTDFPARWDAWYPEAPPLGFLLRDAYPERWLRIHSLPEGQRYPTSGGWQQAELLRCQWTVATDVLDDGAACALLLERVCTGPCSVGTGRRAGLPTPELPSAVALPATLWDEHSGVFVEPIELVGAQVVWQPGAFTGFLTAVANDTVRGLLVNLAAGQVYAPYDGGVDLFFATETERELARARHAAWISKRVDGL